jgi:uncharacterized membrane protein
VTGKIQASCHDIILSNQKNHHKNYTMSKQFSGSQLIRWILIFVFLVIMGGLIIMFRLHSIRQSANINTIEKTMPKANDVLKGRWIRPDGGYILEIRGAAADGTLDALYFNPQPIHVSYAGWQLQNGKLIVFVELRDINYPGSTYSLEFVENEDKLTGAYLQAVEQVTFDVEFRRQK